MYNSGSTSLKLSSYLKFVCAGMLIVCNVLLLLFSSKITSSFFSVKFVFFLTFIKIIFIFIDVLDSLIILKILEKFLCYNM